MRKLVIIFVSLLVVASLLILPASAESLKIDSRNFWDDCVLTIRQFNSEGVMTEKSVPFDSFQSTPSYYSDRGLSYKKANNAWSGLYGGDNGRTYLDFTLNPSYPDNVISYDGGRLNLAITIGGYNSMNFYGVPAISVYYFDDSGNTHAFNENGSFSQNFWYEGSTWFTLQFDLPGVRIDYITVSIPFIGRPASNMLGWGILDTSELRYTTVNDQINSTVSRSSSALSDLSDDLEVPSVDPSDLPSVDLPSFSFQQFYSRGQFIPFMISCSIATVTISLVAYVLFGKKV